MILIKSITIFVCLTVAVYYLLLFLPLIRLCHNYRIPVSRLGILIQLFNIVFNLLLVIIILLV